MQWEAWNSSRVSASSCLHNNSDTCSATGEDTAFLSCVEITIFCGGRNSSTPLVVRWCSGRGSDLYSRGREFDSSALPGNLVNSAFHPFGLGKSSAYFVQDYTYIHISTALTNFSCLWKSGPAQAYWLHGVKAGLNCH